MQDLFLEVNCSGWWCLEWKGGLTILIGDGEITLINHIHSYEDVVVFNIETIDFQIIDYLSVWEGYGYFVQITFAFADSSGFNFSEGLEVEGLCNVWGYDGAFGSCVPTCFFSCEFKRWKLTIVFFLRTSAITKRASMAFGLASVRLLWSWEKRRQGLLSLLPGIRIVWCMVISSFACNCWYSEYFFSEFAYSVYGTWYGYAWVGIVCFDDPTESAMEWSLCVAMVILHAGVCEEFGIGKVFDCVVFECLHFFLAQVIRHLLRCKSTVLSWIMQMKVCYRL